GGRLVGHGILEALLHARVPGILTDDAHAPLAEGGLRISPGAEEALRLRVVAALELRGVEADVHPAGIGEGHRVVVPAVHVEARLLAARGHGGAGAAPPDPVDDA